MTVMTMPNGIVLHSFSELAEQITLQLKPHDVMNT